MVCGVFDYGWKVSGWIFDLVFFVGDFFLVVDLFDVVGVVGFLGCVCGVVGWVFLFVCLV